MSDQRVCRHGKPFTVHCNECEMKGYCACAECEREPDATFRQSALVRLAVMAVVVVLALCFGALLAWFTVEWPQPLPVVPRVIGWVFWPTLTLFTAVAVKETR